MSFPVRICCDLLNIDVTIKTLTVPSEYIALVPKYITLIRYLLSLSPDVTSIETVLEVLGISFS